MYLMYLLQPCLRTQTDTASTTVSAVQAGHCPLLLLNQAREVIQPIAPEAHWTRVPPEYAEQMPWCSWCHAFIIQNVCSVCLYLEVCRTILGWTCSMNPPWKSCRDVSILLFEWLLGSEHKLPVTLHSDSAANVSPSAGHLIVNSWKTLFHVSILCILLAVGASTPSSSSPWQLCKAQNRGTRCIHVHPVYQFDFSQASQWGRTGSWNVNDVGCGYYIDRSCTQGTDLCIG